MTVPAHPNAQAHTAPVLTSAQPPVVIIGAGLAGLAAALRLAQARVPTLVLESRPMPGGRATSFEDPATGHLIDNCQHVAMGCCSAFLSFIHRLGLTHQLEWHDRQWWLEPGGRRSVLAPVPLLAPLLGPLAHAPSFLAARFLSLPAKAAIARALLALARLDRCAWRDRPFTDFLSMHRQPDEAIARFWAPVVISACNLSPDRVSAEPAMQVFQLGLLGGAAASRIAVPRVPLADLFSPVSAALATAGGAIRVRAAARRVRTDPVTHRPIVELQSGELIPCSAVVVATPLDRARSLLAELPAAAAHLTASADLSTSPIVGVRIEFDRPVMDIPHAVLVDMPTQWLFRKTPNGAVVHSVISAADEWMDWPEPRIVAQVTRDIASAFPGVGGAGVIRSRVMKERRATFAAVPGSHRLRPASAVPGLGWLAVAGDATDTGWPATMEGAVRSGDGAAAVILDHLGR